MGIIIILLLQLFVNGEQSIHTGSIRVDFVKGEADNPKVNAIVVLKGTVDSEQPSSFDH